MYTAPSNEEGDATLYVEDGGDPEDGGVFDGWKSTVAAARYNHNGRNLCGCFRAEREHEGTRNHHTQDGGVGVTLQALETPEIPQQRVLSLSPQHAWKDRRLGRPDCSQDLYRVP